MISSQKESNDVIQNGIACPQPDSAASSVIDIRSTANTSDGHLRYLSGAEVSLWDELVTISPQGSPFTRPWWLRAVGGRVRILGYFKDGHLVAGIPLYFEKRFGVTLCTLPKLTQTLGPVLAPFEGRDSKAHSEEMHILDAFADELAKQRVFFQAFHPSLHNWSPFYWRGFTQTTRATKVIDVQSPNKLFENLSNVARRNIRKAERQGIQLNICSPARVWEAESKTFERQKLKVPHSLEYLQRLYRSAKEMGCGECFEAVDRDGRLHSASFMIWDPKRAHFLVSGGDPELRTHGANSLLLWHMIEFAATKTQVIDFSGSMLQPVESFMRDFGTRQVPYMWVMKFPLPLKLYLVARGKI